MDIEKIVTEVISAVRYDKKMTLSLARELSRRMTEEGEKNGNKLVIAIVDEKARPVLTEVMDGAFLVSHPVATRKAYTSVAIKMSTAKLAEEVGKGGSLEGLDTADGLIFLGGGAPLVVNGNVIGGIGISGGTAAEDTAYAETAVKIFNEIIGRC